MSNKVLVHCKNTDQILEINEGDSLLQIYGQSGVELPYQVLCARVNNKTEDLDYRVFRPKDIEFIDASHPSGMRTYVRSLCFVFYKALEDVMSGARLRIEHSISKGYFCGINNRQEISQETTDRIKARMRKIIADNLPFQRIECKTSDAIKLFQEQNLLDKVDLLKTLKSLYTTFYRLDNLIDYYYSCLVPSTGYLNLFDLIKYDGGLLLVPPSTENPSVLGTVVKQDKMLAAFKEYIHFNSIIGLNNVGDLNLAIENRQATDLIKVSEALHEKKISNIADAATKIIACVTSFAPHSEEISAHTAPPASHIDTSCTVTASAAPKIITAVSHKILTCVTSFPLMLTLYHSISKNATEIISKLFS